MGFELQQDQGGVLKLATRTNGTPDGELFVVSRDLSSTVSAASIVPSLLRSLETWEDVEGPLQALYACLNAGRAHGSVAFDPEACAAPLPRAPQWLDASTFPAHGERMVKAFGLPRTSLELPWPLMYQGCSDNFLGACTAMQLPDESHGIDIEAEIAVFTDRVPMGISAEEAASRIRLIALVNDVSLRNLQFAEMSVGFGMIQCKPTSIFSPVCVTPDELGDCYAPPKLELTITVHVNDQQLGSLDSGEMGFSFGQLIAHAAKTRSLAAGTIIGSGTVSNADFSRGCACLAEKRALEMIAHGAIKTGWLRFGDRVRIEGIAEAGVSVFGAIDHTFVQAGRS